MTMLSFAAVLAIPALSQAGDKKVKNEIVMKMGISTPETGPVNHFV